LGTQNGHKAFAYWEYVPIWELHKNQLPLNMGLTKNQALKEVLLELALIRHQRDKRFQELIKRATEEAKPAKPAKSKEEPQKKIDNTK